jgi:GntR family transcriptional regulator
MSTSKILFGGLSTAMLMQRRANVSQPIYLQIADSIGRRIRSGELTIGERLPPERQLCQELAVSRMTVRQALMTLQDQGLIVCRPGVGNFVSKPRIEQPVDVLVGFFDNIAHRGFEPASRLLVAERRLARRSVAQVLQLGLGDSVFHLHRLRLANGAPLALEDSYFPAQRCLALENHDLEKCSVYAILAEECGIRLEYAEQSLQATVARPHEARLLDVLPGAPLMLLERVTYDDGHQPVEYAKDLYRGDSFCFVSRSRPPR